MPTITASDFRNGVTFEMDGQVMQVVEFQHVKPGKGAAFVRTKMKNVIISGVTQRGIFVELENGVEGFVPASSLTATGTTLTEGIRLSDPASGKTWSLGDSMMITIVRADINLGKVDFEVAPESK